MAVKLFCFLTILLFCTASVGKTVHVKGTQGRGVTKAQIQKLEDLISTGFKAIGYLMSVGKKADFTIRPKLFRRKGKYYVILQKYKRNRRVYSRTLQADSFSAVSDLAKKASIELIKRTIANYQSDTSVGELEKMGSTLTDIKREITSSSRHLSLGLVQFSNLGTGNLGVMGTLGMGLDLTTILLQGTLGIGHAILSKAAWFDGGVSAIYFFGNRRITPVVGLDFGYAVVHQDDDLLPTTRWIHDFYVGGRVGFFLFRNQLLNLELVFRASVLLENTELGNPILYATTAAFYL